LLYKRLLREGQKLGADSSVRCVKTGFCAVALCWVMSLINIFVNTGAGGLGTTSLEQLNLNSGVFDRWKGMTPLFLNQGKMWIVGVYVVMGGVVQIQIVIAGTKFGGIV
jgi:hypothetical protein